jgi:hypothetical protein
MYITVKNENLLCKNLELFYMVHNRIPWHILYAMKKSLNFLTVYPTYTLLTLSIMGLRLQFIRMQLQCFTLQSNIFKSIANYNQGAKHLSILTTDKQITCSERKKLILNVKNMLFKQFLLKYGPLKLCPVELYRRPGSGVGKSRPSTWRPR